MFTKVNEVQTLKCTQTKKVKSSSLEDIFTNYFYAKLTESTPILTQC